MQYLIKSRFFSSPYLLTFLISINWILSVYEPIAKATSMAFQLELVGFLLFVIIYELLVIRSAVKFSPAGAKSMITTFLFSVVLIVNFLALFLSFLVPFYSQEIYLIVIELILVFLLFLSLVHFFGKNRTVVAIVSLVYFAVIMSQALGYAFIWPGRNIQESAAPQKLKSLSPDTIKNVTFQRKPNIYFVSFDAMIPNSLTSKHLGIKGTDYASVIESKKFNLFKNHFADRVSTVASLNSFVYLDPTAWDKLPEAVKGEFYTGRLPSPLYEIFKSNGYRINVSDESQYLGGPGDHIDEFMELEPDFRTYCTISGVSRIFIRHFNFCILRAKFLFGAKYDNRKRKFLLERIEALAKSDQPNMFMSYVYAPGHTKLDYKHTIGQRQDYIKAFNQGQIETAAFIEKLVKLISRLDPTGILFIFGDHGPYLSRAVDLKKETASFYIQDRHGVTGAVYPGDACRDVLMPQDIGAYSTPSMIARRIITCLSGGINPINETLDYSGPYPGFGFENLIYE